MLGQARELEIVNNTATSINRCIDERVVFIHHGMRL